MQRSFAEYLLTRGDWAATQAAAKAKILADRYPGVVDDFTTEEARAQITDDPSKLLKSRSYEKLFGSSKKIVVFILSGKI
jgi:hypothetical protein